MEHLDVLILGAGVAGINAAYRVRSQFPTSTFAVLEGRDQIGGTWSFWKYPGFRCDSSMATYAYTWYPWTEEEKVVSGEKIARYLDEAVAKEKLGQYIRLKHRIESLDWVEAEARWVVQVNTEEGKKMISAKWIISCMGYYSYDKALESTIPGLSNFAGQVIHPQWWPEGVTCDGKKVIIVGSGATAMTILPALANVASRVTLLQRSPSYVNSLPSRSALHVLYRFLPALLVARLIRFVDMLLEYLFILFMRRYPNTGRNLLRKNAIAALGPSYSVDQHFKPKYAPWDQRMILTKDGELFEALKKDNTEIITDTIETVDSTGIITASRNHIDADIIITATGLYVDPTGGTKITINGVPVKPNELFAWRGFLMEGVPNLALVSGYPISSYPPGVDALTLTFLKIMRHAQDIGASSARPEMSPEEKRVAERKPFSTIKSNYFVDACKRLPVVTGKGVWHGREMCGRIRE